MMFSCMLTCGFRKSDSFCLFVFCLFNCFFSIPGLFLLCWYQIINKPRLRLSKVSERRSRTVEISRRFYQVIQAMFITKFSVENTRLLFVRNKHSWQTSTGKWGEGLNGLKFSQCSTRILAHYQVCVGKNIYGTCSNSGWGQDSGTWNKDN